MSLFTLSTESKLSKSKSCLGENLDSLLESGLLSLSLVCFGVAVVEDDEEATEGVGDSGTVLRVELGDTIFAAVGGFVGETSFLLDLAASLWIFLALALVLLLGIHEALIAAT